MHKSKLLFAFDKRLDSDCLSQTKVKNLKMEEELKCPLCLDFFKPPFRMTPCGHTFCQECLTGMTAMPWLCPVCRTEQQHRPEELARNFVLERTFEIFINICTAHDLPKNLRKLIFQIVLIQYNIHLKVN